MDINNTAFRIQDINVYMDMDHHSKPVWKHDNNMKQAQAGNAIPCDANAICYDEMSL